MKMRSIVCSKVDVWEDTGSHTWLVTLSDTEQIVGTHWACLCTKLSTSDFETLWQAWCCFGRWMTVSKQNQWLYQSQTLKWIYPCVKNSCPVLFLSNWHKLESLSKRKPQSRKIFPQDYGQDCGAIILINDWYRGPSSLWVELPLGRLSWVA